MVGLSSSAPRTAEVLHLFHNFPSSPLGDRPGSFHALSSLFLSFLLLFSIFFFFIFLPFPTPCFFLSLAFVLGAVTNGSEKRVL